MPDSTTEVASDTHAVPIDPTANVLDKVASEVRRLDDLRENDKQWRSRMDDDRERHAREIRAAESARIDAIRAVDVGAVASARVEAEARATTLANTVVSSADVMRVQVAAAAGAAATALIGEIGPLKKDIADLRQVQYETAGGKTQTQESREVSGSRGAWLGVAVAVVGLLLATVVYMSANTTIATPLPIVPVCPIGFVCTPTAP